jgi:FMN-dependent NADH-azoreductase
MLKEHVMTEQNDYRAKHLLRIDASARGEDSVSRSLADELVTALAQQHAGISITQRDLTDTPPPFVDAAWVDAAFTPVEQRNNAQRNALAVSDGLVQELLDADLLVIGVPIYNFSVPASLKAWIDMVARARMTFRYTSDGVEGLLKGKRAYLVVASGGVPVGSEVDFATAYLHHVLGFIGITDVEIIAADKINRRGDAAIDQAREQIHTLIQQADTNIATAVNLAQASR